MSSMTVVVDHVGGSRRGERQVFDGVDRIRFGRHPDSEVAFHAHKDIDASTRHAELRREGDDWMLVDVGSSNGTRVGGEEVARRVVAPGVAVEVEFGEGGPRCRIFVGPVSRAPEPPTVHGRPAAAAAAASPAPHGTLARVRWAVDQALHHSTRKLKMVIAVVTAVFAASLAGVVVWSLRSRAEERAALRALAEEVGPRIAKANRGALYLLVADGGFEGPEGFCTAFAVAPRHLATSAHCVRAKSELDAEGRAVAVVPNGGGERLTIAGVAEHPGYRAGSDRLSEDVALVEVTETLPRVARLATREELAALETGAQMYTYGFPGEISDPMRPEATLTEGVIGRLTRLDGQPGSFEESLLLQHSAFATGGTSGSPVFDARGRVVGINAGGYMQEGTKAPLQGYNVAIRIDALTELFRRHGVQPGRFE